MTSMLPPLKMETIFFFCTFKCFNAATVRQTGVLHDHLVILYHIEEGNDQFGILHGDDIIHIFLDVREQLIARTLYRRTVRNGVYAVGSVSTWPAFKDSCMQFAPAGSTPITLIFGFKQLCQGGNAGAESASSDRDQDIIYGRELLNDLHGNAFPDRLPHPGHRTDAQRCSRAPQPARMRGHRPHRIHLRTVQPPLHSSLVRFTFISGVVVGITMVAGMPASFAA